jgi:hypothetical protein
MAVLSMHWTRQTLVQRLFPAGSGASGLFSAAATGTKSDSAVAKLTPLLLEMFGDVDYGGRVTDDRDLRVVIATLSPLLDSALSQHLSTRVSFPFPCSAVCLCFDVLFAAW